MNFPLGIIDASKKLLLLFFQRPGSKFNVRDDKVFHPVRNHCNILYGVWTIDALSLVLVTLYRNFYRFAKVAQIFIRSCFRPWSLSRFVKTPWSHLVWGGRTHGRLHPLMVMREHIWNWAILRKKLRSWPNGFSFCIHWLKWMWIKNNIQKNTFMILKSQAMAMHSSRL